MEVKARAVRTVLDSGRPIAQVAKDLDVGSESLRTWVRQARTDAGAYPGAPTSEQLEELRRLRSENRELRETVDTLKAASVFFARELDGTPRR
jgi:transposase